MFRGLDFWTTTKIGVIMKSVRKIIKEMVEKYLMIWNSEQEFVGISDGYTEKRKKIQK